MVSPALSLSPLPVGFLCAGFSFKIIAFELSLPNHCLFPLDKLCLLTNRAKSNLGIAKLPLVYLLL